MTESNYSANFKLFNLEGLQVQFTVRADDEREHLSKLTAYLSELTGDGWRVEMPTGDLRPKTMQVAGWVKGQADDKRLGRLMPCVHLYAPWGDYKWVTVYHEQLGQLPIDVKAAKLWDGAAPDRDTAQKRGVMNEGGFDVVLEPILDYEGNPLKTESGNVRYKFGGVTGGHRGPEPAGADEQREETPFDDDTPIKVRDWIVSGDPVGAAKAWAVASTACANEHEARNSFAKIVQACGGRFTTGNMEEVLTAYYFRQVEKLNEADKPDKLDDVDVAQANGIPF